MLLFVAESKASNVGIELDAGEELIIIGPKKNLFIQAFGDNFKTELTERPKTIKTTGDKTK